MYIETIAALRLIFIFHLLRKCGFIASLIVNSVHNILELFGYLFCCEIFQIFLLLDANWLSASARTTIAPVVSRAIKRSDGTDGLVGCSEAMLSHFTDRYTILLLRGWSQVFDRGGSKMLVLIVKAVEMAG